MKTPDGDLDVKGRSVSKEVFSYLNELKLVEHVLTHVFDSQQERMSDGKGGERKRSRIVNLDLKTHEKNKDLVLQKV